MHENFYVYILTNHPRHTVLYIGITNDLERRLWEHSADRGSQFARQYNAEKLIYFESFPDPRSAIAREKQLKNWSRKKKEELIARANPQWDDVFEQMYALKPLTNDTENRRDPSTSLRSARDDERTRSAEQARKNMCALPSAVEGSRNISENLSSH